MTQKSEQRADLPQLPGADRHPGLRADAMVEHCRAIVESSDDAIISKTMAGMVTSWNTGAQALFGYTAEEIIGKSMLAVFPADRLDEEALILNKIVAGERVEHFETVRVHKDGSLLNVSVTISPIRDAQGRIFGASKIARDISQRIRLEAASRQFEAIVASSDDAIIAKSIDGTITSWNQGAEAMFGFSAREMIGNSMYMLLPPERHGEEDAILAKLRAGEKVDHIETTRLRKDGSEIHVSVTSSPIHDRGGKVTGASKIARDITPLRRKQQEMEYMANFDPLTGLANRLLLADRLGQALSLARREQHTVAVLYLDLDDFKEVNDTHGHDVGDRVLVALAQRMKESIREADTVARMGGDEFVVVLPNAGAAGECTALAERILLACVRPVRVDDLVLQVSASIGMTVFPEDSSDADQLMRHAGQAMFVAKRAGRNRIHVFDSALEAKLQDRSAQLARIAEALEAQEFVLHYQPKVNMREGSVVGVEALIRWEHPERGLLPPADFLPAIEEHPLEYLVGWWVIEQALLRMDEWLAAGLRLPVSVNVGARQLLRAGFSASLATLLGKYARVDPADLELEIIESSALQDIGAVAAGMRDCRALGVRFSVDDFGTGYSSLAYLRRLPAEILKIDQSFVRDMLVDSDDLAIVQSVIALAQAFQRGVIAEGVETVEIGERLLDLGCDVVQGFVVARPMAGQEIPAWVASWQAFPSWKNRPRAA